MNAFSRKPVVKPDVDAFIEGAEDRTGSIVAGLRPSEEMPWQAPGIRDDISKLYNLRLPEPYLLKLRFIAEQTPYSMQKFCLDVLLPAIDEKIDELRGEGGD